MTTVAPAGPDELRRLLVDGGRAGGDATLTVLRGGVSSLVAVVDDGGDRWVVKTPLARLAVADDWQVDRARGANEATVLDHLSGAVGPARVPRLRFFDPAATVLGEELIGGAPPAEDRAPTYRDELLAGRARPEVAAVLGAAAASLHRHPPPAPLDGAGPWALFDALRLDPYYRATARRRPELAAALGALVDETARARPRTLVHGDFNPKNVLVTGGPPVVIDWEVVHAGDPAFDLGMVTAHLLLKALRADPAGGPAPLLAAAALWSAYDGPADPGRSVRHAGAIVLARLHGKSPVTYLPGEAERRRAHEVGAAALLGSVSGIDALLDLAAGASEGAGRSERAGRSEGRR